MANLKSESPLATLAKTPPPPDMSAVPLPSKETIACIAREVGYAVPKATAAEIAKLQADFEAGTANMVAHHYDAARKGWREQEERMANDAAEGRDITRRDAWTKDDWEQDYRAKFLAFRENVFSISQKAHKLSLPLAEGFAAKANSLADKLDMLEMETADRFCVRHVPSDAVLAIRKLADHVLKSSHEFYPKSGASPKTLFAHLPVTFEPSGK
jgi:hypothetical protein